MGDIKEIKKVSIPKIIYYSISILIIALGVALFIYFLVIKKQLGNLDGLFFTLAIFVSFLGLASFGLVFTFIDKRYIINDIEIRVFFGPILHFIDISGNKKIKFFPVFLGRVEIEMDFNSILVKMCDNWVNSKSIIINGIKIL